MEAGCGFCSAVGGAMERWFGNSANEATAAPPSLMISLSLFLQSCSGKLTEFKRYQAVFQCLKQAQLLERTIFSARSYSSQFCHYPDATSALSESVKITVLLSKLDVYKCGSNDGFGEVLPPSGFHFHGTWISTIK